MSLMRNLLMQNSKPSYLGDALIDAVSGGELATELEDGVIIPICQLIKNGDFGDGTTSWNGGYSTLTINDDGSVVAGHTINQDSKYLYYGHYYLFMFDIIGTDFKTHSFSVIKTNGDFTVPSGVNRFNYTSSTSRRIETYIQKMDAEDGKYRFGWTSATYYKFYAFDLSVTGVTELSDFITALGINQISQLPFISPDVSELVAWHGVLHYKV